jgi:surface protein
MKKKILVKNGRALIDEDGKILSSSTIGNIPTGKIEITTTEEIDVSKYETAQVVEPNLEPQNIAKDVNILGVVGTFEGGSSEEYPNEAIKYYKQNRNKNYPYFPLPSEMEETQDTIYMLYGASGYMCCPVFNITFTECVCTIQKYNNTTLVNEYVENVTSNITKYLQFSEEDSDYSTYNYIVIKLQGSITGHYLRCAPKFNGVSYNEYSSSSELIEVSGKCNSCDIKVVNCSYKYHQNLEYYSFLGVTSTNMGYMFSSCYSLQTIPQLDTSNVTDMNNMFNYCSSLQTIPLLDTSNVTNMSNMFDGCRSLQAIPLLDTSSVTNMNNMFSSCYSLQAIPQLDTSSVTSMSSMFSTCYSLQTIPQIDTSKVTNMGYMFSSCYSLQTIPQLDTSNVTDMSSIFNGCYLFIKLDITNMKVSFKLTNSIMLSQSELVKILNNLATITTTQTLTLGSTNLNKLTEEEKAIAQNKNWTLA